MGVIRRYVRTATSVSYRSRVTYPTDATTVHRLLRHEAEVHAVPGRRLRDLGDALLLLDPNDAEPFWNRLEAVRWPSDPAAFDQRLAESAVLFATLGRQPHFWVSPPHDEPHDLAARLAANGFEDAGKGLLMVTLDAAPIRAALPDRPDPAVVVERHSGLAADALGAVADAVVEVLMDAFEVGTERAPGVRAETVASLADPRFMHYLVRVDGRPAAAARRATFDEATYLSSIGTMRWARGRGLGRLITATAAADGFAQASRWVHLGVFADNDPAIALYRGLGFQLSGDPGPDMILVG
jgi:ribosomal protein S18 acetylase RimI-like enzyme